MQLSAPPDGDSLFSRLRAWIAAHPRLAVALVTIGVLCLFLPKPFNVDDPLFLWTARQIQAHPFDPYGFTVNWYGNAEPMWRITENPPLTCYYLAVVTKIVGWSEIVLHLAFLLPALAVILGTYRLAQRFSAANLLPPLLTLLAPGFLVSSTSVMCDVMMLGFWMWAIVLWFEGMEKNRLLLLFAAMALVALAGMTKYFGLCLVPLLLVYGAFCKTKPKLWLLPFAIPIIILGLYEMRTRALYGHGLFSLAAEYSSAAKKYIGFLPVPSAGIGLAFTGGCMLAVIFLSPWLWSKRALAILAGGAVLLGGWLVLSGSLFARYGLTGQSRGLVSAQFLFWVFGGLGVLALAANDLFLRRNPDSLLLFLWVIGTFIFVAFLNWTVNARSILPLIPAVALLIGRRLDTRLSNRPKWPSGIAVALSLSAVLGLFIARADFMLAVAVRDSAWATCEKYGTIPGRLQFEGHWGFQYYAQESGAHPAEIKPLHPAPGVYLAIPLDNSSLEGPNAADVRLVDSFAVQGPRWLTTWSGEAGAGFYASTRGPLPFAINPVLPEAVVVYLWKDSPPK